MVAVLLRPRWCLGHRAAAGPLPMRRWSMRDPAHRTSGARTGSTLKTPRTW